MTSICNAVQFTSLGLRLRNIAHSLMYFFWSLLIVHKWKNDSMIIISGWSMDSTTIYRQDLTPLTVVKNPIFFSITALYSSPSLLLRHSGSCNEKPKSSDTAVSRFFLGGFGCLSNCYPTLGPSRMVSACTFLSFSPKKKPKISTPIR